MNEKYYNTKDCRPSGLGVITFRTVAHVSRGITKNKTSFSFTALVILSLSLLSCGRSGRDPRDIDSLTNPTEQQVQAVWGAPDAFAGDNNKYRVYSFKKEEEWLYFETNSPHHLIGIFSMPLIGTNAPVRGNRNLQEINFNERQTYRQIASIWGRPDDFGGSGVEYYIYRLNDGKYVWLDIGPKGLVLGALLYSSQTRHRIPIKVNAATKR